MSESLIDSMSSPQEISSLRRGVKLKNEAYTNSVLLILSQQIAKGGEGTSSSLVAANICSVIEQLFDVFQDSQTICLNAIVMLNVLVCLSVGVPAAGSNSISRKLLTMPESCSGLLFAIATHLGDHAIVVHGMKLILFLTSQDSLLQKLLAHQSQHLKSLPATLGERKVPSECASISIIDVLTNVMRIYGNDASLMEDVCRAVYNLTYEEEEGMVGSCRSYFVELGMDYLLVNKILLTRIAVSKGPAREERSGSSSAIRKWRTSPLEGVIEDLAAETLTTSDYASDTEVDGPVTAVLGAAIEGAVGELPQAEGGEGDSVLEVDREVDAGLAKWGLRALGALCRHHPQNQQSFGELDACDTVMRLSSRCVLPRALSTANEDAGEGEEKGEASFLESFCWAVSNLADPSGGYTANQMQLIALGACEAVLEALKGSGRKQGGLLVQEGCRALRQLCCESSEGLDRMYRMGVCDIVLDIVRVNCNSQQLPRSRVTPSSSSSSSNASAVQWAWYAVTALAEEDESSPDGALKSSIRTALGRLGACSLLLATLSRYGTAASSSGIGCADVVQWSFSAMSVLVRDLSNAQRMLSGDTCASPASEPGEVASAADYSAVDIRSRGNSVVEKVKSNYAFFSRAASSISMDAEGDDADCAFANATILMKAMNANLSNADVAEEFCNSVCALTAVDSEREQGRSSFRLQRNRQLLLAAGVNELLVKILVAHESSQTAGEGEDDDEDAVAAPVLESAFAAISHFTNYHVDDADSSQKSESGARLSIDRLVGGGLVRLLSRILSLCCTQGCVSPMFLYGARIFNDIACCGGLPSYHSVLSKEGAAGCLVAILHTHPSWIPVASLAAKAISALACGSKSGKIVTVLRKAGCCSALVQAVCVHHRGLIEDGEPVSASLLFLRDLLQSICHLVNGGHVDPGELDRCRASLVREGAHEAVVLVTRTHRITSSAPSPTLAAQNTVIMLCLEVLCRLSGVACSAMERIDHQALSMSCLSLLSLPDGVNPLYVGAFGGDLDGGEREGDEPRSIRPFAIRVVGTGANKEVDSKALGAGVCSALADVIHQALTLMFAIEERGSRGDECIEEKGLCLDESCIENDAAVAESMGPDGDGVGTRDILSSLLVAGCGAVESLAMSDRSHRWLLAEAGVSRDLVLALRLCADETRRRADIQSGSVLMTALCLAIGSMSKDGQGGRKGEEDPFSRALPMLCSVLELCSRQSEDEGTGDESTDRVASAEVLSAAACRAVGYILAGQSRQAKRRRSKGDVRADSSAGDLEGSILKVLRVHSSSLPTSLQVCFAITELALRSSESAEKMGTLGVQELLMTVLATHTPSSFRQETTSSSLPPQVVNREDEVFCMVWCRALYTLLRALGPAFFALGGDTRLSSTSSDCEISRESLASMLLDLASLEGTSAALAGSVSMALSAVISIPSCSASPALASECLEVKLLEKLASSILQKHLGQGDWFSFSLQQAANSISFSKASGGVTVSASQNASAVAAAASGGIIYWDSVFLFQLLSLRQTCSPSVQLLLRKRCLTLGLCDVLHRALGRFTLDESVTAACYMALSAMLNLETGPPHGEGTVQVLHVEAGDAEDESNEMVVCPLSEVSSAHIAAPSSTTLSSFTADKSAEEVAMGSTVSAIMRRLSSLGLGPMCVETLRQYPSSRQVADWCLLCMSLLLAHSEDTVHKICSASACDTLPVCMQAHQSSLQASVSGCVSIHRMIHSTHTAVDFTLTPHTHFQSSAYAVRLGGAGACEAVMSVYRRHGNSAAAITSASRALAALAAVSKGNVGWLGPLGACEVLLMAHDRHSADKLVASAVWNAIGTLCSYNRERLSGLGAPQSAVASLSSHFIGGNVGTDRAAESAFASSAAYAIGRLCEPLHDGSLPGNLLNRRALFSAGCCEVLTTVLRSEYSDVRAATNIFRAIATLTNGPYCYLERESFGMYGACAAVAVAMKQHLHHEEAAIYSCQAIRSLCSCGDESNQLLLRSAGVCDLVTLVLKASVPLATSQMFRSDSSENIAAVADQGSDSRGGMFSQIVNRARTFSNINKLIGPAVDKTFIPNIRSVAAPPHALPLFGAGFGTEWNDKLRVSLAAVRAISCLTSSSSLDRDGDDTGSNSAAKALLGEEGVIEIMVEIGTSSSAPGEGLDRDPSMGLALAQWTSLALCHLIDPSEDSRCDVYSDGDDLEYYSSRKSTNLNLNRLCFCNRSGEFLVASVLSSLASNSGVSPGDVDALIFNVLSVMVSMCEDRVGNHKILSADGMGKMILMLMGRFAAPSPGTEGKWLTMLCLSLASSCAASPVLAEVLVQGGFCKLLASALLSTLLPAAMKAIQQQSSTDMTRSHIRRSNSYSQHVGSVTDMDANGLIEEHTGLRDDDLMTPISRSSGSIGREQSDSAPPSRQLQGLRSDFETATFTGQLVRNERKWRGTNAGTIAELRVTSAVRSIIDGTNLSSVREAAERRCLYDPESMDVLALVLAREACNALTLLLTSTSIAVSIAAERSAQEGRAGLPVGGSRSRSFSTSVGLFRDGGGAPAGGVSGSLVDALSTVLLVADSSLMFFSSGVGPRHLQADPGESVRDHLRENVSPSSVLLPAVKELRQVVQTTMRCIQLQQQQRRNIL